MPNTHSTLESLFNDIATAIRTKKGEPSTVKYVADNFPSAIAGIPTGGGGGSISSVTRKESTFNSDILTPIFNAGPKIEPDPTADYYLAIVEAFHADDDTSSGYSYGLYSSDNLSAAISSGNSGTCGSMSVSQGTLLAFNVRIERATGRSQNAFYSAFTIKL